MKTLTLSLMILGHALGSSDVGEVQMRPKRGRNDAYGGSKVETGMFAAPCEPDAILNTNLYCTFNDKDEALCASREPCGDVKSLIAFNVTGRDTGTQVSSVLTYPHIGQVKKKQTWSKKALKKVKSLVVGGAAAPKTAKEPPFNRRYDITLHRDSPVITGFTEIDTSQSAKLESKEPDRYLEFTFIDKFNDHKKYIFDRVDEADFQDVFEAYDRKSHFKFGSARPEVSLEYDGGGLTLTRLGEKTKVTKDELSHNRYWWAHDLKINYGFFFKLPSGRYAFAADDVILRGPPLVTNV